MINEFELMHMISHSTIDEYGVQEEKVKNSVHISTSYAILFKSGAPVFSQLAPGY